jgi:HAD superfamily hydrolase (TIGR01450 family)
MSLKDKKLFLLDMDGTIYEGARLFECVNEFLAHIESVGGQYVFITNNSSRSVKDYVIKLSNMGIKVTEDNFFTSSQATALYLNKHFPNKKIYCMGTKSMIAEMEKYGVNITTEADEDTDCICVGYDT